MIVPNPSAGVRRWHSVPWLLDLLRGTTAIAKLLKFGLFPFSDMLPVPLWRRQSFAVRVRRYLEELGLTYLKLGQFLALRFDVLPREVCLELNHLFESVPPMPQGEAERTIERELGAPPAALFAEFSTIPIAAASVGQVHDARLLDGSRVAVKVQRVGIEAVFRADIRNLRRIAAIGQRLGVFGRMSGPGMVDQFASWTLREMDFRIEGRTADQVRRNSGPMVTIPAVHWNLTTARVITQEFIEGVSATKLRTLIESNAAEELARSLPGFDLAKALNNFVDAALSQVFVDGFFHGDPHPGNIVFLPDSRVAFLDFGIFGSLNDEKREVVTGQIECLALGDIGRGMRYFRLQTLATDETNIERFNRDCRAILRRWHQALSDPTSPIEERHLARHSGEMIGASKTSGLDYDLSYLLFWRAMNNLNATVWHVEPNFDLLPALHRFFGSIRPGGVARIWSMVKAPAWQEAMVELGGNFNRDCADGIAAVWARRPSTRATHAWSPNREYRQTIRGRGGAVLLLLPATVTLMRASALGSSVRWSLAATAVAFLVIAWRQR